MGGGGWGGGAVVLGIRDSTNVPTWHSQTLRETRRRICSCMVRAAPVACCVLRVARQTLPRYVLALASLTVNCRERFKLIVQRFQLYLVKVGCFLQRFNGCPGQRAGVVFEPWVEGLLQQLHSGVG